MKSLEIIHLRSPGEQAENLVSLIKESMGNEIDHEREVTVYRSEGVPCDLAVHIRHERVTGRDGRSGLGLRLAASLRAYGLVKHTVWRELERVSKVTYF